jgi:hypothetical protein
MSILLRVSFAALLMATLVFIAVPGFTQSGDLKNSEKASPAQAADPAKEISRGADEFAEAARLISGPAGNPECVWLGRRVVGLLWRDDMDTAFRHLDLYDRFGCPGQHIQASFACVVRQGNIDPKATQSLNSRVQACWLNPSTPPTAISTAVSTTVAPAASTPSATNPSAGTGTTR